MANWCYTGIKIEDENAKEFFEKLKEWTSKDYCDNGFGKMWLGNIIGNSGIDNRDSGDFTLNCQGEITEMYMPDDNAIIISTETAWVPALKMWRILLNTYLPDADLVYTAEECGMGIYVSNDPYYVGNYVIDSNDDSIIESSSCISPKELQGILQNLLHTEETNIDKLMEMKEDSEFEDVFYIHQWDMVESEDFE